MNNPLAKILGLLVVAMVAGPSIPSAVDACVRVPPPLDPGFDGPARTLCVVDAHGQFAPAEAFVYTQRPYARWTVPPDCAVAVPEAALVTLVSASGYEPKYRSRGWVGPSFERVELSRYGSIAVSVRGEFATRSSYRLYRDGKSWTETALEGRRATFDDLNPGHTVVALYDRDTPIAWTTVRVVPGQETTVVLSIREPLPPAVVQIRNREGDPFRRATVDLTQGTSTQYRLLGGSNNEAPDGQVELAGAYAGSSWGVFCADNFEPIGEFVLRPGRQVVTVDPAKCDEDDEP